VKSVAKNWKKLGSPRTVMPEEEQEQEETEGGGESGGRCMFDIFK
jgi:hypothetical protein